MAVLKLEEPFSSLWKRAYIRSCSDGRKRVDLVNTNKDRTTTTYARYLVGVKIGRVLSSDEEADHIDIDKTNDSIENLQLLSVYDHLVKTNSEKTPASTQEVLCDYCEATFTIETRKVRDKTRFLCSKKCNAKYNREFNNWVGCPLVVTKDVGEAISRLIQEGNTNYSIGKRLGITPSSVLHYRKTQGSIDKACTEATEHNVPAATN